jgi:hypothetical protein
VTADTDIIEAEVREIPAERAVVPQQPGQALVAATDDPSGMVAVASRLATVLKSIVEQQKLYATISGKKYPQVEAWMTIGRLDNVVAREPTPPIRHDDGSYEAFAELVRLSDGMVVGSSSALCGTPDDKPWGSRSEPARRSMAQTRATSRAFRQQYSWIMALAGYEATPAEEMPHDPPRTAQEPPAWRPSAQVDDGYAGTAEIGRDPQGNVKQSSDFELRQTTKGWLLGFRLSMGPRKGMGVEVHGPLAEALAENRSTFLDQPVTCYGQIATRSFDKAKPDGSTAKIKYDVLTLERIVAPDLTLSDEALATAAADASSPGPTAETPAPDLDAELDRLGL